MAGISAARDAEITAQHTADTLQGDATQKELEWKHEKAKLHTTVDTLTKTLHTAQAEAAGRPLCCHMPSLARVEPRTPLFPEQRDEDDEGNSGVDLTRC